MLNFIFLLVIVTGVLYLIHASSSISSGVYLPAVCRKETSEHEVILTFDDGVHPDNTPLVLDVLRRHHVRACFFLIAEQAARYPELVRRIADEGHLIGIHSYRHTPRFTVMSRSRVINDLNDSRILLERLSGREVTLFRPPYGVTNPNIGRAVRFLGYTTVGWDIRSLDTMRLGHKFVLNRIRRRLHPGAIILLHDRLSGSDQLLEEVLTLLHQHNYHTTLL